MRFHKFVNCLHLPTEKRDFDGHDLLHLLLLPPAHLNHVLNIIVLGADVDEVQGVHVGGLELHSDHGAIDQMKPEEAIS